MSVGSKVLFLSCIAAALVIIGSPAATPLPYTPYIPPVDTEPSQPDVSTVTYPSAIEIFSRLQGNFGLVVNKMKNFSFGTDATDPLSSVNAPSLGLQLIRSKANVLNAAGQAKPEMLLPFMKYSSVYAYSGCDGPTGNPFSGGHHCDQYGFCVFPFRVYKTSDNYYIALFDKTTYTGNLALVTTPGAALYDPDMNYVGKATLNTDSFGMHYEIHPPGSPEFKTSDIGTSC